MARHKPQKRFGQHFLSDECTLDRIVRLINPTAADTIVEIGPGEGVLTIPLAKSGARLLTVEFDRDLIAPLARKLAAYPKARVIEQDFLQFSPDEISGSFTLVGNIPYNITSPIIDWCARYADRLSKVVLMMQREMARRICGRPGTKDWAPISIFTQLAFDVHYEFEVPPSAFTPPPEVHSAVISMIPKTARPSIDMAKFERVVRAAFEHRRKLLVNNLVPEIVPTAAEHAKYLSAIGAREDCRGEQVSIEQFVRLTELLIADGRL
jgi:16S rRNA (adenine1518-N6/adenine1519-N6)-dimethyltransferase